MPTEDSVDAVSFRTPVNINLQLLLHFINRGQYKSNKLYSGLSYYLYEHTVLPGLLPGRFQVFLQRLLLGGHSLQLGGIVRHQLIPRLSQLPLLTIQGLQKEHTQCRKRRRSVRNLAPG